ncbi:MAG TPA: hypothetical protein VF185_02665 [Patescibacteria group bacterium]
MAQPELCIRCGRQLVPDHKNIAFYTCNGTPTDPHPDYDLSSKFVVDEYEETWIPKKPQKEPKIKESMVK